MRKPARVPGQQNVFVRGSRVHGRGLFARKPLKKGQKIVEYVGEKIDKEEGERRTWAQWDRGTVFVFELDDDHDIDGSPEWNLARFGNHSCDPNTETQILDGHIWVIALRDIEEGEEITYDYNFPLDEDLLECRCGADDCCGYIVAAEHRPKLAAHLRALEE